LGSLVCGLRTTATQRVALGNLLGRDLVLTLSDYRRGPLVFCLLLSLLLSATAKSEQKSLVFSSVFAIVWIGEAIVTLQIKLLGGNMYARNAIHPLLPALLLSADGTISYRSFFQSVCIIGYTLFPLVIAALLSALHLPTIPRVPVYLVLICWSLAAGVSILGGSGVLRNRVGIAVYPLLVFYVGLGCLCFIS
jgi:protein YIPF6